MRITVLTLFLCLACPQLTWATGDAWAILKMIATQTQEHQQRLSQLKKQVDYLRLATEGLDGVGFVTDLRNVIVEGEDFLNDIDKVMRSGNNLSKEWEDIFGDLQEWSVEESDQKYASIGLTDQVNTDSYAISGRFQEKYKENAEAISRLAANARQVNEKGALKQIGESMAHLLQMQNQILYLMSQQVKQQSIENANNNMERK